MNYSNEELLRMHYHLLRGRVFTLKMHECVLNGHVRSSYHTAYGEEAISTAIGCAMSESDWFSPSHRDQPMSIQRCDLYKYICDIFGKVDGMSKGTGFDTHVSDYSDGVRMLAPIGTITGSGAHSAGFAWERKRKGFNDVMLITGGDGAVSEGGVYEMWELFQLFNNPKAPVVQVIRNNGWAMTVPNSRELANPIISDRAAAMGIPTQYVEDGNNILAVREAMDRAIEMARNGQPNIVELKTLRWEAHFFGQGNAYRDDNDKIAWSMEHDDCVKRYETYLLENNVCDQKYLDETKEKIEAEIDDAVARAILADIPKKEEIFTMSNIYANVETGGDM